MSLTEGVAGGDALIELTVKSANQSFDDLIVQFDRFSSVKQLKETLVSLCPCKLLIEDQKLIYSGKLLTDDLILKDILRTFDDPEVNKKQRHIFHLVYSSKTKQAMPTPLNKTATTPPIVSSTSTPTTDGLRQRNIQPTSEPILSSASSVTNSSNSANMFQFPAGPAGSQYFLAQQMAMHNWMQQVYWQYMNQYMNSSNSSENRPQGGQPFIQQNFIPQMPAMPYFPTNTFPQPTTATASPQVAQPEQQQQIPAPAQAAQPRFPNIVQEEQENRDWLDIFYLGCRLMLFVMLIYFYSSATRCIVVIGGAVGIYMYHNGYFRNRNPVGANNVRNVEEPVQAERQNQEDAVDNTPQAPSNEESNVTEASVTSEVHNSASSVMSIIKTFVVTFITSLLPDTQTL